MKYLDTLIWVLGVVVCILFVSKYIFTEYAGALVAWGGRCSLLFFAASIYRWLRKKEVKDR